MTKLYLAIPCYNEEEVLWDTAEKLLNKYYDMMSVYRRRLARQDLGHHQGSA